MKNMLGVSKDGDGTELSLELSIGGCYKETEKPLKESEKLHDENKNINNNHNLLEAFVGHAKDEENGLDQQRKRDFHALRRQEARRKKAEKQKRLVSSKEKMNLFEAQKFQTRVEDREKKVEEFVRKNNGDHVQDLNVSFNLSSQKSRMLSNVQVQYRPYVNGGFGNPFWGNQSGGKEMVDEKNLKKLFQPLAIKSFRPYQNGYGNGDLSGASSVGFDLEHKNGEKCGPGNQKVVSNGSLERTSSAFSDYQSSSQKGGSCSTDTGSHSNNSQGCQQQLSASATSTILERSDINASSSQITSHQVNLKTTNFHAKPASSNFPTPQHQDPKKTNPVNNLSLAPQEPTSSSSKGSSEVATNPLKPHTDEQHTTPLRQMPFVSTKGNGPNGKTINGFLYRYTKTEVCIVCACHGCSFSPAEFVEHAGGVDISHPLRHITIVPASFG